MLIKIGAKKQTAEAPQQTAPAPVVEEPEDEEEDDCELVAVITAAIAASEGTAADGLVVRSIRKVGRQNNWKIKLKYLIINQPQTAVERRKQ